MKDGVADTISEKTRHLPAGGAGRPEGRDGSQLHWGGSTQGEMSNDQPFRVEFCPERPTLIGRSARKSLDLLVALFGKF